jgi:nucleoside-diphosphate-sugar epimerase
MRIFLAGAAGVAGRSVTRLLVEAGHEVTGTTRTAKGAELIRALGGHAVQLDVYDRPALALALQHARPDAVIHQLTDLRGSDTSGNARIRIEGTRNLVDAATAAGVRRMIAQSIAFVYAPGAGPAAETDPLDLDAPVPRRLTVEAVKALEDAVGELPEGVVLRYGSFYGPGSRYARDGVTAGQVRRGELAATPSVTSFVHVEDAARAALLSLDWPPGVFNIVDDEPVAGKEWLPIYADLLGAPAPLTSLEAGRGARGASNAKARQQLGWQPIFPGWREGLRSALG